MTKFVVENWTPKGLAFHEILRDARVSVWAEDGICYTNDPDKLAELMAAYDPIPPALSEAIKRVKDEAQKRIYQILPAYKQTNLMAQGLQNTLMYGPDSDQWPADQRAVKAYADACWARIAALRVASNAIEAKLSSITDFDTLDAYDASTDAAWPE